MDKPPEQAHAEPDTGDMAGSTPPRERAGAGPPSPQPPPAGYVANGYVAPQSPQRPRRSAGNCSMCGGSIEQGDAFCASCGARTVEAPADVRSEGAVPAPPPSSSFTRSRPVETEPDPVAPRPLLNPSALAWFHRRPKNQRIGLAAVPILLVIIVIAAASGGGGSFSVDGGGATALSDNSSCSAYDAASVGQQEAYVATLPSSEQSSLSLGLDGLPGNATGILATFCDDNPTGRLASVAAADGQASSP